ncbi:unnamed protein product [Fraxinus pennsylvanica]|uniref:S-adenosylmethionine decarboxylase proenzyme n=1 Tax=Fraxinus pennsylvanica TaxID=56036 RepID=A0AAD1ZXQ3_9LAMI|nr:unnamed protein product [Fraxinus pennsylvanica]
MCMTCLDQKKASVFYKTELSSAAIMTEDSGIRKILPDSEICDFDFEPCGYSMNAIEGDAVSTIHVTPEDGFSYASFEAVGYNFNLLDFSQLLERVLSCFQPAKFSVALHSNAGRMELDSEFTFDVKKYICGERSCKVLGNGGSIMYSSFTLDSCGSPRSILHRCWNENEDEEVGMK